MTSVELSFIQFLIPGSIEGSVTNENVKME